MLINNFVGVSEIKHGVTNERKSIRTFWDTIIFKFFLKKCIELKISGFFSA